jgi:NAD-dependent deacetylase
MSVLFVTGAGISANAGIPTYRDTGSSWTDSDLEKKSHKSRYGNHLDELWDRHWGPLSYAMARAEPTHTHKAIAAFQKKHEAIIATQNIDDLHERAGSDNVAHVHGVMNGRCIKCNSKIIRDWDGNGAPECAKCGSKKTRPDVVLFGEMLSRKLMNGLERFAQGPETTHIIAVGTSLNVYPAAGLLLDTVGKVGKTTIYINKQPAPMQKWMSHVFNDDCDSVIDQVLAEIEARDFS